MINLVIKSLKKKRKNLFEFAVILIFILENNSRIELIKREMFYSLAVNILAGIKIIKPENSSIYYGRDTIAIDFCKNLKVLVIITLNSEKILRIIYVIKEISFPLKVYFTIS